MYKAVFEMTTSLQGAPEEIKPFIIFDAKRRGIEIKDGDSFVILRVETTTSFVVVPLDTELTLQDVEKQLKEIETELDEKARDMLKQLLSLK
jgi:hypothetical protein